MLTRFTNTNIKAQYKSHMYQSLQYLRKDIFGDAFKLNMFYICLWAIAANRHIVFI